MSRSSRLSLAALMVILAAACQASAPSAPAAPPPVSPPTPPAALPIEALRSLVPAVISSGCGTPIVDGVISPDEWKDAVSVRFGAILPDSSGGGTVPAEIMSMSDDKNLYVAYRYHADTSVYYQSHAVELDANHSNYPDTGDDAWLVNWYPYPAPLGITTFYDDYRGPCLVNGVKQDCAPEDTDPTTGFGTPGTSDGGAAFRVEGGVTTVEMWHPYRSGDARDVSALPGDTVPLNFQIRLLDNCGDWPRCYGDTYFPGVWQYRPFLLACGAPPKHDGGDDDEDVIEVRIDVKPGDPLPTISLGSGGVTTVAVHGSAAFDVAKVDTATLWFAGAPVALDGGGAPRTSSSDVNGDGVPDLVAKFETAALELRVGDDEASLAGRTLAGRRFHGTDAVRVIP
jgi:hypothetical protein